MEAGMRECEQSKWTVNISVGSLTLGLDSLPCPLCQLLRLIFVGNLSWEILSGGGARIEIIKRDYPGEPKHGHCTIKTAGNSE